MATVEHINSYTTRAHRIHANTTNLIVFQINYRTFMFPFGLDRETRFAVFTMKRFLLTANSTESALITVVIILLLKIIVKQIAYVTEITSKLDCAVLTRLLRLLNFTTFVALNLSNRMMIHQMTFLHVF